MEPKSKKAKPDDNETKATPEGPTCKHFVKRKKRFCKMTVAKGKEYCGEHEPQTEPKEGEEICDEGRIPCPLDAKHSIYKKNLRKHLKICNARPKDLPPYIVPGINSGEDTGDMGTSTESLKLSEVPGARLKSIIDKVKELYGKHVDGQISRIHQSHSVLEDELAKEEYGFETRKHLLQTASLLGNIENNGLFQDSTSFVEFGAGKGHLSYWLAQTLVGNDSCKVILIDRMSHRHKKDNKIEDKNVVHRIRADIADFSISQLDLLHDSKKVVAVSKHLCGVATDLTLRCVLQDEKKKTEAVLIAVCCHHRCEWGPFVGKDFFLANGLSRDDFVLITKMASWAICGSGFSREKRKLLSDESKENDQLKDSVSLKEREEIGLQCKRVIDYARVEYLKKNGFLASLNFYVDKDITLENVCILGLREKEK